MNQSIAVFDVDGTLLRGDCLWMAALRSRGFIWQCKTAIFCLPWFILWQLRVVSTGYFKQHLIAAFGICEALNKAQVEDPLHNWLLPDLKRRLRPEALQRLRWHQARGDRVLLCSASPRPLLQPLADWLEVELLCTELELFRGHWHSKLASPNCKGPEKVRRLREHLGPLEELHIEAYGDSKGDRELLQAAAVPHYRSFCSAPNPYPASALARLLPALALAPPSRSPSLGMVPEKMRALLMKKAALTPIRSAFVLGSTSVVARALCHELAERGCRRFHLVARDPERNHSLASELESRFGASVSLEQTDLLADAALEPPRRPEVGLFDLYLITAGSLGDAELARVDAAESLQITAANYSGLLPWLLAIATPERLSQPGRLWVFSSVAADRGRPSNYTYGAAKSALSAFCEGLLLRCHGKPFAVRIIKAGFMATPMTVGKAPPMLCVSPASVARDLLRRPGRRGIEYLPWWWSPLMLLIRLLPAPFASKL